MHVCVSFQYVPAICVAVRQRCLTLRDMHNAWFLYWYEAVPPFVPFYPRSYFSRNNFN